MIDFVDEKGSLLARVFIGVAKSRVTCRDGGASVFRALKNIPCEVALVTAHYPSLQRTFVINRGDEMNLDHIERHLEDFPESTLAEPESKPPVFVAPYSGDARDDGVFRYVHVTSLKELIEPEPGCVLLFDERESALLNLLTARPALFAVRAQVLADLPGLAYPAWFAEETYGLERVNYGTLVNEIRASERVAAAIAAENQSAESRERAAYTRANGSVRLHKTVETETADDLASGATSSGSGDAQPGDVNSVEDFQL